MCLLGALQREIPIKEVNLEVCPILVDVVYVIFRIFQKMEKSDIWRTSKALGGVFHNLVRQKGVGIEGET